MSSGGMWGANVEQLHGLGATFKLKPGDIDALISAVDGALTNTVWEGPAKDQFHADWEGSFKGTLGKLKEAFDAAGNECQQRASSLQQLMGAR